ncbi:aspartate kinase domain protein, partial [Vibrio cholerae HC-41B1]
ADCRG